MNESCKPSHLSLKTCTAVNAVLYNVMDQPVVSRLSTDKFLIFVKLVQNLGEADLNAELHVSTSNGWGNKIFF